MTIAAGFICSDGIILCADAEQTQGESKYQKDKIFDWNNYLLVTGAGNSAFLTMTFDKLSDRLAETLPDNPSDARRVIEEVVLDVHEKHIFKFSGYSDPNRPSFDIIAAVRCATGELALVKTESDAAYLADMYVATGAGQPLFEYWAKYFYRHT